MSLATPKRQNSLLAEQFLLGFFFQNYSSNKFNYSYFYRFFQNFIFHVTIAISPTIIYVSIVVGWLYFIAWSASFYPQIYDNYQRKSVVGLNFDYLSFNLLGFVMYGAFNIGLYWDLSIQVIFVSVFMIFIILHFFSTLRLSISNDIRPV